MQAVSPAYLGWHQFCPRAPRDVFKKINLLETKDFMNEQTDKVIITAKERKKNEGEIER